MMICPVFKNEYQTCDRIACPFMKQGLCDYPYHISLGVVEANKVTVSHAKVSTLSPGKEE